MIGEFESWVEQLETADLLLGLAILSLELGRMIYRRRLGWKQAGDMLASLSTQIPFYFTGFAAFALSISLMSGLYAVTPVALPANGMTLAAAILLADFAYYWEHRIAHRVRILWLSHAVHHSSPQMNIATSARFGPLEAFTAIPFHLPIVALGFHPLMVIFAHLVVIAYQTWLHTELVGRLGILDRFVNTPSNHRVHHGSDGIHLDRNFGGILMVWDRLFGTYQAEEKIPVYGLTEQIDTNNPLRVWFSEWPQFFRDLRGARGPGEFLRYMLKPPGWRPRRLREAGE